MTSRCGATSRCMAKTLLLLKQYSKSCLFLSCTAWGGLRIRYPQALTASFSSSQASAVRVRYTNQRYRNHYDHWKPRKQFPGFRNETPEHRLVRENQLFNPFEHRVGDNDRRRALQESTHKGTLPLELATTSELEREMIHHSTQSIRGKSRSSKILSILLRDRKQNVKILHYETLIALNASPHEGSAASIKKLLEEMDAQNIACDVNTYTSILRSLVVHPDVDILNQVLDGCTALWIELDTEMLHYITAIYLRLGMLEMALDHLDRIEGLSRSAASVTGVDSAEKQSGQTDLWLYVLFINRLAEENDWEGVLRICYRLNDDPSIGPFGMRQLDIPYAFWHKLLRRAVESEELWVTSWLWNTWVIRRWFRPSLALCAGALNLFMKNDLKDQAYGAIKIMRMLPMPSDEVINLTYKQRKFLASSSHAREARQALVQRIKEDMKIAEGTLKITAPTKEQARIAAHWVVFEHDSYSKSFAPAGMRINPWSVLSDDGADPGELWARISNQRMERDAYADQLRNLGEITSSNRATRAAVSDGLSALPDEVQVDLAKMANMDFELRLSKLQDRQLTARQPMQGSIEEYRESISIDPEHELNYVDDDEEEEEEDPFEPLASGQTSHTFSKANTVRRAPASRLP